MPTNVDKHFQEESKDFEFRAEYALLDLAEKLSAQIRVRREAKGLSQKALAELLGTKQSQVSRLEDPLYSRYSLLTLAKVADVLGCRLDAGLVPNAQTVLVDVPISWTHGTNGIWPSVYPTDALSGFPIESPCLGPIYS